MHRLRIATYLIASLFVACATKEPKKSSDAMGQLSDVKVGMTYDEVESLLGKPAAIDRGVNELELTPGCEFSKGVQLAQHGRHSRPDTISATLHIAPWKVKNIGSLLYVTWVYDQVPEDTVVLSEMGSFPITEPYEEIQYILNGTIRVSKDLYDRVNPATNDYVDQRLSTGEWFIVSFDGKDMGDYNQGAAKVKNRSTRTVKKSRTTGMRHEMMYSRFRTECRAAVVFDASSGRAVTSCYEPMSAGFIAGSATHKN